jgi:tight adherence protein C
MTTLPLAAALLLVMAGTVFIVAGLRSRTLSPVDQLIAEFESYGTAAPLDEYQERLQQGIGNRLLLPFGQALAGWAQSLLPRNHMEAISRRIVLAGLGGRWSAEEHVAAQLLGGVIGTLLGVGGGVVMDWSSFRTVLLAAGVGALGWFAPSLWVKQARDKRVEAIEKDLPDVLDLLAISVEAGVGLEGAIKSVSDKFPGPLGDELSHTLSEMELGTSRRDALEHLRQRTDVPDLDGFILSLLQASALGMPLTRVLKTEAEELRRRRRQRVREAAAKLPVKLVFPLIVFIMPALFVVIIGPAIVRIGSSLLGGDLG